jgi:hypothetical protein
MTDTPVDAIRTEEAGLVLTLAVELCEGTVRSRMRQRRLARRTRRFRKPLLCPLSCGGSSGASVERDG